MLKRNYAYNKGAVEYTQDGIRLKCSVAGTTGSTDIVVDQPTITDGTVTWKLVDYAGVNYSLDEKKIGTWIDGKPLYQKTYNLISPYKSDGKVELTELPIGVNAENVVAISAIITSNDGAFTPQWINKTDDGYCIFVRPNRKIVCQVDISNKEHKPLFVTIQYTKTTD